MKAILASQNAHKSSEFAAAVPKIQIMPAPAPIDVDENGSTFAQNARIKATAYAEAFHTNTLADDSGLCVDFLNGMPGIYSARFATLPPDIDNEPDRTAANNRKLLRALNGVPKSQRTAHFVCSLCLIIVEPDDIQNIIKKNILLPEIQYYSKDNTILSGDISQTHHIIISVEGHANGYILNDLTGCGGFGYDPLFYSFEAECTFAQLTAQQKLTVSHRGLAIKLLNDCLGKL